MKSALQATGTASYNLTSCYTVLGQTQWGAVYIYVPLVSRLSRGACEVMSLSRICSYGTSLKSVAADCMEGSWEHQQFGPISKFVR